MTNQVKIRQIEMNIINVLETGIENTADIASTLNLTYSAVHSVLNRMVMYYIVQRKGNGLYGPMKGDFIVASDAEVIAYRRKKKDRLDQKETSSIMNLPDEIVDFVRLQYRSNVERSVILQRLRNNGIDLSKFMLNQIIYTHGIDRAYSQRNRAAESELLSV
ncbi:hypothetical protein ABER99_21840 [Paenibacillus glucanolyticus]|jgi:hypothetical protein|uniref:Uncharacterized protein n=1 Tax=Paenibacillus glucanolyticus TaxID=59843 RepID=A0A163GPT5_9BACL|nr:hypothetical protein [Paenibacillus glucanolyticus]KZS45080.1 hypothetical protein AWU65_03620 [Paenibacillus glucanolyticus]OMF65499.1 hypothetical protein BK142_30875 [Paenibacillus glucanolyticus]